MRSMLVPARMANLLTAGDAVRARELLPRTVRSGAGEHGRCPSAAQLLARLLFLEGDPAGAATALGMSQAIRGTFDHGDTELRSPRGGARGTARPDRIRQRLPAGRRHDTT